MEDAESMEARSGGGRKWSTKKLDGFIPRGVFWSTENLARFGEIRKRGEGMGVGNELLGDILIRLRVLTVRRRYLLLYFGDTWFEDTAVGNGSHLPPCLRNVLFGDRGTDR